MEHEPWTTRLGRELQDLAEGGADEQKLAALEHGLIRAIHQVKFIRRCYNMEAHSEAQ